MHEIPDDPSTHAWSLIRVWRWAFAASAAISAYYVVEGWLLDIQSAGVRLVAPSGPTLASVIPTWVAWALLAPAVLRFFVRHPVERRTWRRVLLAYAAAAAGFAVAHGILSVPVFLWGIGAPGGQGAVAWAEPARVLWWTALRAPAAVMQFVTFAAVYNAIAAWRAARDRETAAAHLREALVRAELDALKLRLEPHFLFNTLNAITSYIRTSPATAERMVGQLSRLLRAVLEVRDKQEIPLSQELGLVESYLDVQRLRFGTRLQASVLVAPDLRDALVPSLLLQPLVENAVHHGVSRRTGVGRLQVVAARDGEALRLCVSESDAGDLASGTSGGDYAVADATRGPSSGTGVGLSTTRTRLAQLYGAAAALTLVRGSRGSRVDVTIPFRTSASR